ncbi:hypothetical protein COHA_007181 [Chlorella ohadii]|uniref:Methyltransferase type 11 domain-containing protein n=1 Tax=Chlorella ohadii TaxID=2649997 RepID=A0AAD5DRC3_9CHLO|nr:hypothetical protein COHA_007181 [Chlorella ohadii]
MAQAQASAATSRSRRTVHLQDFGAIAAGYTEWVLDRPLTIGLFQAFVDELAPQLSGRPGAKILDVASAAGEPAFTLARALPQARRCLLRQPACMHSCRLGRATVYATDIAVEFVGLAEQRAVRQGLTNVVCQQADAERLAQFGDGSVDAVTCCMGLMFVPNVASAFAAFRRVLRPGGVLGYRLAAGRGGTFLRCP